MHLPFLLQLEVREMSRQIIAVSIGEPNAGLLQEKLLIPDAITFSSWDIFIIYEGFLPSQSRRHFTLLFPTSDFAAKGKLCSPVSNY